MYNKKHSGKNTRNTDFTKEVIRRAAISMNISEVELVATVIEQEFPRIAEAVEKAGK